MNNWGILALECTTNKIAKEQKDSAAAFKQQERHCEKRCGQDVKNPTKLWLQVFQSI